MERKMLTGASSKVAWSSVAASIIALAIAFNAGTLLLVGGSTALSTSALMIGKNKDLPFGTVTLRVAAPPNVPVRKKYLLAGPIPCSCPLVANSPVVSTIGLVFVPFMGV